MSRLKQQRADTARLEKVRNKKLRAWRKRNKRRFRPPPPPESEE